jgi:hypothetical protein
MARDWESQPILIWHIWLPSSFEKALSFHANIMHTSQGFERDMSQNSSCETRDRKVSSSMRSTPAHPEQNVKASRTAMPHQLLEIRQHCQATDFVSFLTGDQSWSFRNMPIMVFGPRPAPSYRKRPWENWHWKVRDFDHLVISGIPRLPALTKGMKENPQYFCQDVTPEIQ